MTKQGQGRRRACTRWTRAAGLAWMVSLLALCGISAAVAQETPESFLNGLATLDSRYLPSGSGGTGEAIDLYTGSLGFVVTDVSLPGNSDLPVALTRRFQTGMPGDNGGGYAFGDWQLDVPVIEGVVSAETTNNPAGDAQDGWRTDVPSRAHDRCSLFGRLPWIYVSHPQAAFEAEEYWDGFRLWIPGMGAQTPLRRAIGNDHAPSAPIEGSSPFPVVTKNDWMVACLPSLKNDEPGEGFLVVAPDGRRFWFDWLTYQWASPLEKPVDHTQDGTSGDDDRPDSDPFAYLSRKRAMLYVSKVEDRFGHTVTYTYDPDIPGRLIRIEADDGRRIDLFRANGAIDHVTAQSASGQSRTWSYAYVESNGHRSLQRVTLPDATRWTYDLMSLAYPRLSFAGGGCSAFGDPESPVGHAVGGDPKVATVTTPGGLLVTYTAWLTARGHADTPIGCLYSDAVKRPGTPNYPETYYLWSLRTRKATGAGLPARTWAYSYSEPNGSWSTQCTPTCPATTVWTQVKDPEGHVAKYTYSNLYDATEGQLRGVEYRNSATGPVIRSEARQYADADAGPWPVDYGYGNMIRTNYRQSSRRTPLQQRTTTEGGIHYTWTAHTWDGWAEPLTITRSSSGANAQSVSETLAYENNTAVWVLGQPKSRTVTAPAAYAGTVPESRSYDAGDATLASIRRFGHPVASYTWYPTGNAAAGRLWSMADGLNHTTTYGGYQYGVPTTIQYADGTSLGLEVNAFGDVLSVTDELGHVTRVTRDDLGRITHKTFPTDAGISWAPVDVSYQAVATSDYGVSGTHWKVTATQGNRRDVTIYDAALNPVLAASRDTGTGQGTMTWRSFDSAGAETFASYPLPYGASLPATRPGVATVHDALGRITKRQADSELGTLNTTTQYLSGSEVEVTDPKGHHTTTVYQAFDQPEATNPLKVTFPDGTKTTIARDVWGKPVAMTQSGTYNGATLSVTHRFVYDPRQRLCVQTSPESGQTVYGYDDAGNLLWSAQGQSGWTACPLKTAIPAAARIERSYDPRNRLLTVHYPSGTDDTTFTYDRTGKVRTATRGSATWTSTYLNRGNLQSETLAIDGKTFAVGYAYDTLGHPRVLTYPSGRQIDYAPDALGRPTKVGAYADTLDYAPGGMLTGLTYANGVDYVASPNTRNLLASESYGLGATPMAARTYAWDRNANLAAITDSVTGSGDCHVPDTIFCDGFDGAVPLAGTDTRSYVYDTLDRLTKRTSARYGDETFTYDPLGNLRSRRNFASSSAWTYDSHNRLNGNEYDSRGNPTKVGTAPLTWNLANELVKDLYDTTFAHDARGWRVKQHVIVNGGHTRYDVYDAGHQLIERVDNTAVTDFVYLGSRPIARIEGNQTTYIHGDYQNSPLLETGASGAITRMPDYWSYGQAINADGQSQIPGYTGAINDKETGLVYLGARYLYDGRFLSIDPAPLDPTTPSGLNRYAYVGNNPASFVDPTGQQREGENGYGWYGNEWNFFHDSFLGRLLADTFGGPIALFRSDHYNPINGKILDGGELQSAKLGVLAAAMPVGRVEQASIYSFREAGQALGKGFGSFSSLKRAIGSAGEGNQWHHIVEQSQVGRFGAEAIHNTDNIVAVPTEIHRQISGFYSSIQPQVTGSSLTVRQWLSTKPFEMQRNFGLGVLKDFGVE